MIPTANRDCYDQGDVEMPRNRVTFAASVEFVVAAVPNDDLDLKNRVTLLAATVESAVPSVSNEDQHSKWRSQQGNAHSEQAALSAASRLAELKASGGRFAENDYYEIIGLEKYMSHDLLTTITEGKRSHINGVVVMQRYCDAIHLSQLSEESSLWSRERAHNMALLYFKFPDDDMTT